MVAFWKYCRSIPAIFWNHSGSILHVFWKFSRNTWWFFYGLLGMFWEKSANISFQWANLKNSRAFRWRALNLKIGGFPVTEGKIKKLAGIPPQWTKVIHWRAFLFSGPNWKIVKHSVKECQIFILFRFWHEKRIYKSIIKTLRLYIFFYDFRRSLRSRCGPLQAPPCHWDVPKTLQDVDLRFPRCIHDA